MAKKQKYYVVWNGAEDGIFTSWEACQQSVSGYSGAQFASFKSEEEAEAAYAMGYDAYKEMSAAKAETEATEAEAPSTSSADDTQQPSPTTATEPWRRLVDNGIVPAEAIAVDAACSGNPGRMEYRGVYLRTGKEIFRSKVMHGTNNIGEFLAIVHGLALLQQQGLPTMPIYSDSVNAQLWVRRRQCKTTLVRNDNTEELYQLIARAESWLKNNQYANPIIKWRTEEWGEIPADFGRK